MLSWSWPTIGGPWWSGLAVASGGDGAVFDEAQAELLTGPDDCRVLAVTGLSYQISASRGRRRHEQATSTNLIFVANTWYPMSAEDAIRASRIGHLALVGAYTWAHADIGGHDYEWRDGTEIAWLISDIFVNASVVTAEMGPNGPVHVHEERRTATGESVLRLVDWVFGYAGRNIVSIDYVARITGAGVEESHVELSSTGLPRRITATITLERWARATKNDRQRVRVEEYTLSEVGTECVHSEVARESKESLDWRTK